MNGLTNDWPFAGFRRPNFCNVLLLGLGSRAGFRQPKSVPLVLLD